MAAEPDELIIPGLFDSGPDHWQSHWQRTRARCHRVELGDWHEPSPDLWVARLDRAIARRQGPVLLIAHSLGCLAVARWASEASPPRLGKVRGALLVAPPDVDRRDAHPLIRPFAPTPRVALPFRSLLVASRDDRYADFGRSAWMAQTWGAECVDAGHLGHINVDSDLGDWPQGLGLLDRLRDGASPAVSERGRPGGDHAPPLASAKRIGRS